MYSTNPEESPRGPRWIALALVRARTRIGHAGTLDPLATGVLVLCLGSATRLVEYVQRMSKAYQCTICLGARSDTDDADGVITPSVGARVPGSSEVINALSGFIGTVDQVPPAYSAAKVDGHRAYALARKKEEVVLSPRPVEIYGIDLIRYDYPEVEIEVGCGKGTYIRSLARDLGEKLGSGAFVRTLRRTRIGPFTQERAVSLEVDVETALAHLLPAAEAVADLPQLVLAKPEREHLRHGLAIRLPDGVSAQGDVIAVLDEMGTLTALVTFDLASNSLRPEKVFG